MKVSSLIFLAPFLFVSGASADSDNLDFAKKCLNLPLPKLHPENDTRPTPWASEAKINGSYCCSSLDEIRDKIDEVDIQLVQLLGIRTQLDAQAAFWKSTRASVNVPSRNIEVINEAIGNATQDGAAKFIVNATFFALLDSSVDYEDCVWDSFHPQK
ncbi:hypothetical protein PILCRDRAFT_610417 [Piloderma croceum F 1598]|uniref:Chorismate mutase domain-containing protein n=1 Tax=Piloderma croceum (strain F 1598) TaxID=765440 RepID=A0A0C3BKG0_PILCF|nr:hypothetical protein PILCRDRAFT_610417 [Piloderma croceum F 1598]